jgi:hypothetical protein
LLSQNIKIKIYRTIILPVALYGCETWLFTLREIGRLGVFEKRVLRRIFEPKRDEVTGKWRKLHNELNDRYASPFYLGDQIENGKGAVSIYGREERWLQGFGEET